MIPDRDLPCPEGDPCPSCGALVGETHARRCGVPAPDDVAAVVFLDFDGVINTTATYAHADVAALIFTANEDTSAQLIERDLVARVQGICDATDAGVVVVSAWRAWFDVPALSRLLRGAGLTAPVIDAVGGVKMSGDLRAAALLEWLRERPEVTAWCVIDDGVDHYGCPHRALGVRYHRPEFVGRCVHPADGITDADADRAVAILRFGAVGPRNVDGDGREVGP